MDAYLSLDGLRHLWEGIRQVLSAYARTDLLWEQDTVSNFASQTIELDLSAYDAVRIEYAGMTTQSNIRVMQDVRVGAAGILSFVSGYNDKIHTRTVTVTADGIKFGNANASSSTTVTTSCIPTRIWGVTCAEYR